VTEKKSNAEALELIYKQTMGGPAPQQTSFDSIDGKAVQVFAAASVVLGLGTFTTATHLRGIATLLYIVAVLAYIVAGRAAWSIVRVRSFRVVDGADRWWPTHRRADPGYLIEQLLDDLATAFRENRARLEVKGQPIDFLLSATAIEAVLVAGAVIARLA
jgi:hypothetical protein